MVVDIIIIVILALSIFFGYKKGLVELGIGLCAGIIAIVVALTLYSRTDSSRDSTRIIL